MRRHLLMLAMFAGLVPSDATAQTQSLKPDPVDGFDPFQSGKTPKPRRPRGLPASGPVWVRPYKGKRPRTERDLERLAKARAKRARRRKRNRKLEQARLKREGEALLAQVHRCPKCSMWIVPGQGHDFCPVADQEARDWRNRQ